MRVAFAQAPPGPSVSSSPGGSPIAPFDGGPPDGGISDGGLASGSLADGAAAEFEPPPAPLLPVPLQPASPAGASDASIEGLILEKGNRDPLPEVRVTFTPLPPSLPAEPKETTSDSSGRFRLPGLTPGVYLVQFRGSGLRPSTARESITRRRKVVSYYIPRRERVFETVVRAEAVRREVSEQVLDVNELKRIPGNSNDAIKAVQNLPGVARAPFGGGQLIVWGSSPGDTRVYADGVLIPRIYHFGGLRATINAEFVTDLSFKPGAYSADFGRGLGGIVDVSTRSPKSDRIHGSVTLDLIDGSVTLEGPLTKKLHVAIGARVSWISAFLPLFNRSNFQISPVYWDYQLALRYQPTTRDDLDVFVFGSTDDISARVENPDPATNVDINSHSYFSRVRLRYTHRFSRNTTLTVMPSIGGDTQTINTGDNGIGGVLFKLSTLTLGYNLRSELRHRTTDWLQLFFGVDFEGQRISFDVLAPDLGGNGFGQSASAASLVSSSQDQSVLHIVRTAPYLIARFEFLDRRLILSPQLRLDTTYIRSYDGEISRWLVASEPRLALSYQVIPRRLLLKAGVGVFSQLPSGQQLTQVFGNPQLLLAYGTTYVAGVEVEPTATLSLQGQFFYKDLRALVVADPVTRYSNGGLGRVIGGDFLLRQRLWRGLFGWIAYTVSRSERKDAVDTPWRLFAFDQTHILTLIVSYKLPFWGLEAGVRFRYVTGNPTTPTVGGIRNTVEQTWAAIAGADYSVRLPDFHQLDLRIDKTWTFNRWKLGIFLDIQNLYNRANTETLVYGGRQLAQVAPISGIPFFPNLGLRADF